jgi:hypothetical protein
MSWINEEYRNLDQSPKALRSFGFLVGSVFLLLGALFVWRHRGAGWPFVSIGAVLVVAGAAIPKALQWVHAFWMMIAVMLGWVVTRILLTIVFFLVVTPVGLLQRVFGKRAIEVDFRASAASYWQARTARPAPEEYEKQF